MKIEIELTDLEKDVLLTDVVDEEYIIEWVNKLIKENINQRKRQKVKRVMMRLYDAGEDIPKDEHDLVKKGIDKDILDYKGRLAKREQERREKLKAEKDDYEG